MAVGPGGAKAVRVEDELLGGNHDRRIDAEGNVTGTSEGSGPCVSARTRGEEAYAKDLDARIRDLHGRLKAKRYRHQPIRRVHIPKSPGKTRPIGVSCIEDKVVQGALRELLETVYERDFLRHPLVWWR